MRLFRLAILIAAGLAGAFVLIVLPSYGREFTRAGLEGRYFLQYYSIFFVSVWLILVATAGFGEVLSRAKLSSWAIVGALAGYLSGFISLILGNLFRRGGRHVVLEQSSKLSEWGFRLVYPLVNLNWLVGSVGAVFAVLLSRLFNEGSFHLRG